MQGKVQQGYSIIDIGIDKSKTSKAFSTQWNEASYINDTQKLDEKSVNSAIQSFSFLGKDCNYERSETIEPKKIVEAIDQFDGSKLSPEELWKNPQWIKITDMAKETLKICLKIP